MAQWTLDQVYGVTTPFDASNLYGHSFKLTLVVTYRPSTFGKFVELPRLDWHEKFIMLEHHKQERWSFEANMYEHNPLSVTLLVWARRYLQAYQSVHGQAQEGMGTVRFLSLKNTPVTKADLGTAMDRASQADAVRSYLKKNGGRLEITVHDVPSLTFPDMVVVAPKPGVFIGANRPVPEKKERLLLFDVGLTGGGPRWKGYQHVKVDGAVPQASWTRTASPGWVMQDLPLPPGYKQVVPPTLVSIPRPPMFAGYECW